MESDGDDAPIDLNAPVLAVDDLEGNDIAGDEKLVEPELSDGDNSHGIAERTLRHGLIWRACERRIGLERRSLCNADNRP
jgi:hypothetical protein